jgi:hypothetical protein
MIEMDMTYDGPWRGGDATSASLSLDDHYKGYSGTVICDAPLIKGDALDLSGQKVETVRRARKGDELEWFQCKVYCLDIGQWIPSKAMYALEGVDHLFVLVLAPSATTPGAYQRLGMTDSSRGSGYKGHVRRQVWGDLPVTRITIV